jgi:hypothetical protein
MSIHAIDVLGAAIVGVLGLIPIALFVGNWLDAKNEHRNKSN